MQIQIFNVPLTDNGDGLSEMNRFLAGHKVLEVEQRFFQNEKGGCWSFCVRYLPSVSNFQNAVKEKIDYKQVFKCCTKTPHVGLALISLLSDSCID